MIPLFPSCKDAVSEGYVGLRFLKTWQNGIYVTQRTVYGYKHVNTAMRLAMEGVDCLNMLVANLP